MKRTPLCRLAPALTIFACLLAAPPAMGATASVDVSSTVTNNGQTIFSNSSSESGTDVAMQIGGGVTIWLSKRVGVRGAASYLRVMGDGDGANAVRVAGGVTFGF